MRMLVKKNEEEPRFLPPELDKAYHGNEDVNGDEIKDGDEHDGIEDIVPICSPSRDQYFHLK